MENNLQLDYLIVGSGLAGCCLAQQLVSNSKKVLIVANPKIIPASYVGAGIANPIIGKNLNLTWMANQLFPYAKNFYQDLEKESKESFLYPKKILRIFINQQQRNKFEEKSNDLDFQNYVSKQEYETPKNIKANHGFFITKHSFWLDSKKFCSVLNQEHLLEENLDYNDLKIDHDKIFWKNYCLKKVIFCDGINALNNPYANFLKFRPAKGEILDLKINNLSNQFIYNFANFLLPIQENIFRLGATYSWDKFDDPPSTIAKEELITNMKKYFDLDFEIISQEKSVRPIVHGQKPVIGPHPEYKNILFFNGLGSKGVLQAPYISQVLSDFILNNQGIPTEISTKRFYETN